MKWVALIMLVACGEDANIEGNYSIALTNRDNGCNFANYTVGDQESGIPVVITQEGAAATATVNGGAGLVLDLALGSRVYSGNVDGDEFVLELFGTRGQQSGNCSFTYNSVIDASIAGDAISGRIEYRAATNNNPNCASIEGCLTFQDFNGTRPPP
jgi:hypothetical protein